MIIRTEKTVGKKRIVIKISSSGVDKSREAVKAVMGPGWEYVDEIEKNELRKEDVH